MKNYIALYYNTSGSHTAAPPMTDEEAQAMMAPWGAWKEKYGTRIIDMGAPLLTARASMNGTVWSLSKNLVTGYSIVSAASQAEAEEMFEGHPIYNYPDHAIEISACVPM